MENFANLQNECSNVKALLAAKDVKPPPSGNGIKKPPKWQEGEPEVVELDGTIRKWCSKALMAHGLKLMLLMSMSTVVANKTNASSD
jgi:hypothetical protein